MTAVGEPFQALVPLAEIPIHDDDLFVEAFPGTRQIAAHQVVIFVRVMVRVEHVAPDIEPHRRTRDGGIAQDLDARLHVVGEQCSRIKVAALAGVAPIQHADLVVRHHVTFRAPGGVHSFGLIAEQFEGLRLGGTNHCLVVVNSHGVVVRDAEPRAVWQGRFDDRRFVINVIGTVPWLIAHARIGEFLEITSFNQSPALLDFHQQRRAGAANQIQ